MKTELTTSLFVIGTQSDRDDLVVRSFRKMNS